MPLAERAYYTQSVVHLLGILENDADQQAKLKTMTDPDVDMSSIRDNSIYLADSYSCLAIYAADMVHFRCLDGNESLETLKYYKYLVVSWRGVGDLVNKDFMTLIIFTDKKNLPTINGLQAKALITEQNEIALELGATKNLLIKQFTDVDSIYCTDLYHLGLKADDTRAVSNGIFDVSPVVIDGKLDHKNEQARLAHLLVGNHTDAVYNLDNTIDQYDSRIHKKYWAENLLVRKLHAITTDVACNGLMYSNYVRQLIKEACAFNTNISWNTFSCVPFSVQPLPKLGTLSACIINTLTPLFAINYLCMLKAATGVNMCVIYDVHTLKIIGRYSIEMLSNRIYSAGEAVLRRRARAAELRASRPKRERIKPEDLDYEIEL